MKVATLETITRALHKHDVRFLVVGGLAVAAHGFVRYTADLDLVIQLKPENIKAGFAALAEAGYQPNVPITAEQFADAERRNGWIRDKGMVVLNFWSSQHMATPLDVFVSEPFPFDEEYDAALVQELIPAYPLRFPRLQTLITMKLAANRPKDQIDVQQLRKYHGL